MDTFYKQPADQLDYDVDFSRWLPDGDTILMTDEPVVAPAGELTVSAIQINSQIVKLWLTGGVSGVSYKLTFTATTNGGRIKETEFKVRVRDQ